VTGPRASRLAAVLFIVTAALFAVGVNTEPDQHDESAEVAADTHDEATEGEAGQEESEAEDERAHDEATETSGAHDEDDEDLLGIDVESPAMIALAVVLSLVLAGALWTRPARLVAVGGAAFAVTFGVLDVAEVAHQLDESRAGFAVLAITVAIGHAAAALAAGRTAMDPA
jgi:hypothetical protein